MDGLGVAQRTILLLRAVLAQRARATRDRPAYRKNIVKVLNIAFPDGAPGGSTAYGELDGPIRDCAPIVHSRGGFFSCIAITSSNSRYFAKCIFTGGREARFWKAWQDGAVRDKGKYYKLLPPTSIQKAGYLTILVFPEIESNSIIGKKRHRYLSNIDQVVHSIADFNSDHMQLEAGQFQVSRDCNGPPLPSRSQVQHALGVDGDRAREIVRTLGLVEPGWNTLKDQVYRSSHCLCHMDFGPGNIVLRDGPSIILDFGHVGTAPIGSDLHTVLRYARIPGSRRVEKDHLVTTYANVFSEKGIEVDTGSIRRALEAHFATRYRNLNVPSARNSEIFDEALATSLALLGQ